MKTKVIPSSWMEREGRRLEGRPYLSGAFELKVLLEKLKTQPLQNLTRGGRNGLVNPGRISRVWVDNPEYGVPFLSSTDILQADLSNLSLISKKAVQLNPKLLIQEGWILITRAGTIGKMAYCRPDMAGMACTEDVLRVIPDPNKISPGYLYAYLSSNFGVPLVICKTYGAIIQHIEASHIADLPIPIPPKELETRVNTLIQESTYLLVRYQTLIETATKTLFKANNIDNITRYLWLTQTKDLGFTIKSSELNTLRAWNHSRRAERIISSIKLGRWDTLGDVVDLSWLKWRKLFQRIDADPEYGIEVITQKPLFRLYPEGRWLSRNYLLSHSSSYIVPDQTILIAKQGTLGENELYCRCEFITGEKMLARAYSDHCMRVVVRKDRILPGYLFAFLRSEAGFRLLRSLSEGSKQQDLHYRTVSTLPIPRCNEESELKIHEMILSAYEARNTAVDLEIQARELVEKWLVEAGGGSPYDS